MLNFIIKDIQKEEYKEWDEFVDDSPYGTIFHKTYWLESFGEDFKIYGCFKDNKLFAGLPVIFIDSSLGVRSIYHPELTAYLGIVFKELQDKYVSEISQRKEVCTIIAKKLKDDFDDLYIKFSPNFNDLQSFIWEGFSAFVKYTYILDIEDLESVWMNMSTKRRNNMRRAKRDMICIDEEDKFDEILSIQQTSYERLGVDIDFQTIASRHHEILKQKKKCHFFLAKKATGEPVAGAYMIWDNKRSYYIIGGYDHIKSHHGALTLAVWEAIRYTKEELNLNQFDFVGSMVPDVENYFRKFGGILTPYYAIRWSNKKANLVRQAKKYSNFALKKLRIK